VTLQNYAVPDNAIGAWPVDGIRVRLSQPVTASGKFSGCSISA